MSKANLTVRNHEQNMSKQNKDLDARLSDVYDMLCEKYSIDLTHEALALSGQLPIEELKEERSRDLENSIECDAFDEVHEMPPGHKATRHGLTSGEESKRQVNIVGSAARS